MIVRLLPLTPKRIYAGIKYRAVRYLDALLAFLMDFILWIWPAVWRVIAFFDRMLPAQGAIRRAFTHVVFTHPWRRWHRYAYIPKRRDAFFEYIVTFFYKYPICPGDVVVQIGASFGEETARFARSVGPKGKVFAVEPEARNLRSLETTFTEDTFPQVTVVPKAASDRRGTMQMLVGGEREHRIAGIPGELTYEWWDVADSLDESRYRAKVDVEADIIDNILLPYSLDRIDFILVETNGSELEVVRGMLGMLPITRRLGVRGHVRRNGVPIHHSISALLQEQGFHTCITSEGMVLARRPCP